MSQQIYLALDPTSQAVYNTSTHRMVPIDATICNSSEECCLPENFTYWETLHRKDLCQNNGESTILGVVLGIFMSGVTVVAYNGGNYLEKWCCPPGVHMAEVVELAVREPIAIE